MWRPSSTSVIRRMASYFPARIRENSRLLSSSSSSALHEASAASPSLSPDAVHMTESCVQRMKELQANEESTHEKMLRLSVETGGCSGFQYVFDLDESTNSDDRIFVKDGVKLVVDNMSYDFVKGATVDYVEELIRSAFQQHLSVSEWHDRRVVLKSLVKLMCVTIIYSSMSRASLFLCEEFPRSNCCNYLDLDLDLDLDMAPDLLCASQVTTNPSAVGGCSCKSSFIVKQ